MNAALRIDTYLAKLPDWRGKLLARLRKLIREADPELVEEWKWSTPVWSRNGNVVACGAFRDHVKINFFEGASVPDPKRLFNAGLDAKRSRAIDVHEREVLDEAAFKALVRAAAALHAQGPATSKSKPKPKPKPKVEKQGKAPARSAATKAPRRSRPRKDE